MKTPQWLNILMIIVAIILFALRNFIFEQYSANSFYLMVLCIVLIFIFLPRAIVSSPEKVRTTLVHNAIINTGTNASWTSILAGFAILSMFLFNFDIWIKIILSSIIFLVSLVYWIYNFSKPIEEKREIVDRAFSEEVMDRVRRRQPINFAVICVAIVVFGILYYTQADQNLFVLLGSFIVPLIIISFYKRYVNSL